MKIVKQRHFTDKEIIDHKLRNDIADVSLVKKERLYKRDKGLCYCAEDHFLFSCPLDIKQKTNLYLQCLRSASSTKECGCQLRTWID